MPVTATAALAGSAVRGGRGGAGAGPRPRGGGGAARTRPGSAAPPAAGASSAGPPEDSALGGCSALRSRAGGEARRGAGGGCLPPGSGRNCPDLTAEGGPASWALGSGRGRRGRRECEDRAVASGAAQETLPRQPRRRREAGVTPSEGRGDGPGAAVPGQDCPTGSAGPSQAPGVPEAPGCWAPRGRGRAPLPVRLTVSPPLPAASVPVPTENRGEVPSPASLGAAGRPTAGGYGDSWGRGAGGQGLGGGPESPGGPGTSGRGCGHGLGRGIRLDGGPFGERTLDPGPLGGARCPVAAARRPVLGRRGEEAPHPQQPEDSCPAPAPRPGELPLAPAPARFFRAGQGRAMAVATPVLAAWALTSLQKLPSDTSGVMAARRNRYQPRLLSSGCGSSV